MTSATSFVRSDIDPSTQEAKPLFLSGVRALANPTQEHALSPRPGSPFCTQWLTWTPPSVPRGTTGETLAAAGIGPAAEPLEALPTDDPWRLRRCLRRLPRNSRQAG